MLARRWFESTAPAAESPLSPNHCQALAEPDRQQNMSPYKPHYAACLLRHDHSPPGNRQRNRKYTRPERPASPDQTEFSFVAAVAIDALACKSPKSHRTHRLRSRTTLFV